MGFLKFIIISLIMVIFASAPVLGSPPSTDRVINGHEASKAIPYLVSIQTNGAHICVGFIYNELWVITAASCILGISISSLRVSINDYNFDVSNEPFEQKDLVYRVIINDGFEMATKANDIALLELSLPLKLVPFKTNQEASVILGPSCVRFDEVPPEYVEGTFSGWGSDTVGGEATKVLHTGYLKLQPSSVCDNVTAYPSFTGKNMICVSGEPIPTVPVSTNPSLTTAPCSRDEGSPFIYYNGDGEPVVIGIFSYNNECDIETPSVFTRISVYYAWITQTADILAVDYCYKTAGSNRNTSIREA